MKTLKTFTLLIAIFIANNIYAQSVTLDPAFGENGMTELSFSRVDFLFDFDKSGNIIAVGENYNYGGPIVSRYITIVRTNADGIIDKTFGTNGIVRLEFNTPNIGAFKITNENKIFIYATALSDDWQRYPFFMQLNEDGSFDETYGDNGIMILSSFLYILNTETDDFILFTSNHSFSNDIRKCNYNGEIDPTFGDNGVLYLTDGEEFRVFPKAVKVLRDQSILVAGTGYSGSEAELALCKLTTDGNFVNNFANNGIWRMDIIDDSYYYDDGITTEYFSRIIEDHTGNLILLGTIDIDYGFAGPQHNERIFPLYVCSFNSDGILNSDFGTDGFFYHYFKGRYYPIAQNILQYENKYMIGFQRHKIIGMNNNGILDTGFNNTGEFIFDVSENHYFGAMKHQGDNKIILGAYEYKSSSTDIPILTRLNISPGVSVKETPYTENRITIYPNPTTGELNLIQGIAGQARNDVRSIEVFDVYGRKVSSHTSYPTPYTSYLINLSHLTSGIYFVKVITEQGEVVKKVVKH